MTQLTIASFPFGSPDRFCFFDDYPCELNIGGIIYPSVRHAVIALKTNSAQIRKQIAEIKLPSNLKEFDKTLPIRKWWSDEFVRKNMKKFTLKKFLQHSKLAEKLLETQEEYLKYVLIPGTVYQGLFQSWEDNEDGKILMEVRALLRRIKKQPIKK